MLLESNQVFLGHHTRYVLLVRVFPLLFPRFLLVGSALAFRLNSCLSGFESLSLNQLCVTHFFILFLLLFHNCELGLLKYFHPGLLKCLQAQHVQHWLNLLVKVEKFKIVVENLSLLAVLFGWHLGLE